MKHETDTETVDLHKSSEEQDVSPKTVEEVVSLIASDASDEPKRYLDEVVVPDGGE